MKEVTVRFFAIFRENAGTGQCVHETESQNLQQLFTEMADRFPGLHEEAAALVAVNDEMSDWTSNFNEGDEVLFFPPVAGG
jgi:molybdopterin converting factor small subunit